MERCHKFSYPMRRRPGRHPGWQQFLSEMWQKTPYEEGTEVRGVGAGGDQQDDALEAYGQMTDTELKAVWAYLQTVPTVEKGNR